MQKLLLVLAFLAISSYCNDFYNAELGQEFLMYSKVSYCPKDDIKYWTCKSCEKSIKMVEIQVETNFLYGAQAYVGYDESYGSEEKNRIVIAFRGSNNIRNWFSNLHFEKTRYPNCNGCEVHPGFYNVWTSIKDAVLKHYKVLREKYPKAKLVITGHSLGAAVATFCAAEMAYQKINIGRVIVFAAPRCGNKQFVYWASHLVPNYVIVIHYKDPVPHLPSLIQGFRRLPTEVWYKNNKGLKWEWCPSVAPHENNHCSDKYDIFLSVSEHTNYLDQYTGCGDVDSEYLDNLDVLVEDYKVENDTFDETQFLSMQDYDQLE